MVRYQHPLTIHNTTSDTPLTLNACALDLARVHSAVVIQPAARAAHHQQLAAIAASAVCKHACSRVLAPVHVLQSAIDISI